MLSPEVFDRSRSNTLVVSLREVWALHLWLRVLLLSAEAGCPAGFQDLLTGIDVSLSAYERSDMAAFEKHHANLLLDVDCANAILEPQQALQLHILGALRTWAREDHSSTRKALTAAYSVLPELELLTEVSVADIALEQLSEKVRKRRSPVKPVELPVVPWSLWLVDGQRGQIQVDQGRPVLLQLLDTREGWLETWYLPAGGLPPEFGGKPQASLALPVWAAEASESSPSSDGQEPESLRESAPAPSERIRAESRKLLEDTGLERIVNRSLKPLREGRRTSARRTKKHTGDKTTASGASATVEATTATKETRTSSEAAAQGTWTPSRRVYGIASLGMPVQVNLGYSWGRSRQLRTTVGVSIYMPHVIAAELGASWSPRGGPWGGGLRLGPALWLDRQEGWDRSLYVSYGVALRRQVPGQLLVLTAGIGRVENTHQAWWTPHLAVGLEI